MNQNREMTNQEYKSKLIEERELFIKHFEGFLKTYPNQIADSIGHTIQDSLTFYNILQDSKIEIELLDIMKKKVEIENLVKFCDEKNLLSLSASEIYVVVTYYSLNN